LLVVNLFSAESSSSQQQYFRFYTAADGLPSNTIASGPKERPVFQDQDGFIWLGTFGGVSIYDGHQFKNFTVENGGLSADIVFSFFERSRDEVWVIESTCVDVFVKRNRVRSIPIRGYLLSNFVLTKAGEVFTSRDEEIFRIRDYKPERIGPAPCNIIRIFETGDYFLIEQLNPDSLFLVDKSFQKIAARLPGRIYKDRYRRFWHVDSRFNLLDTLGLQKGIFNLLPAPSPMSDVGFPGKKIIDFLADADGYYWVIAGAKDGVTRIDHQGVLKYFHIAASSLVEDNDGNIWMPGNAGFSKFYNKYNDFYSEKDGLPTEDVTGIAEDERNGSAWVVHKKGISCIYQSRIYNFTLPGPPSVAWTSVKVQNDSLFVWNDKIYLFRVSYAPQPGIVLLKTWKRSEWSTDFVSAMQTDKMGAVMWNLQDFGLFRVTRDNRMQRVFESGLWTFFIDGNELWTGGLNDGLARWKIFYESDTMRLELISRYGHLPDNHIRTIAKDANGNFWVGTIYKGILKFEKQKDNSFVIRNYFSKEGLSNPWVIKISINRSGEIFAGTMGGIYQVHPLKDSVYIENLTSRYGGISATWDYVYNAKNNFWLATPAGVVFVRNDEYTATKPPKVFFTQLLKNNIADSSVFNRGNKKLSHNENNLVFSFSATSLRDEDNVLYSYQLLKGDDTSGWSQPQKIHSISFVSLAPGSYLLNVKAVTHDKVWSEIPAQYSFIISPPWWATWWFRLLAAAGAVAAVLGLYKLRLSEIRKIMAIRLKISRDLHDEVGSTLSGIGLLSEVAMQQLNNNKTAEAKNSIYKINVNSDEMLEKMSDIVWAINPGNDSFEKMIHRLKTYAKNTTDSMGIQLHFRPPEEFERYKLDMQTKSNVYLICKEAINNAVKYSGCHNLSFVLQHEDHRLSIGVIDDGKGFDTLKDFDGNGLKNMVSRAREINADLSLNSEKDKGTSVNLLVKFT